MLFNSFVFAGFFLAVYALYLALHRSVRAQNRLLLVASYVFYGYWDWRFLFLLAASTVVDFVAAGRMENIADAAPAGARRRLWLGVSLSFNLLLLGIFKYYNFFAASFADLLGQFGMRADPATLEVILPVGISFYTFQTMSYSIDVYRKRIPAVRSLVDFALFVSFFPQLVAGPIERATTLVPQILSPRRPTRAQVEAGLFLILSGYYKKVVIADNLAAIVDPVFGAYRTYSGLDLLLGMLAFTFQIYCDFSGYTDIARGIARLMGFELMLNFRLPYFARNPSDFWRRWHISLSAWLRDYLYVPLGGNRQGRLLTYRNLLVTMLIGGLWHGAAGNFVLWGAFHGGLLVAYRFWSDWRGSPRTVAPAGWLVVPRIALMFALTVIGWVIFRSSSVQQVWYMLTHLSLQPSPGSAGWMFVLVVLVGPLVLVQLLEERTRDLLVMNKVPVWVRAPMFGLVLAAIVAFGATRSSPFIYFQF